MGSTPTKATLTYSSAFKRQLKRLSRKYRRVRSDIDPVIDQLIQGDTPGEQLPDLDYTIYKVRVRNTDAKRGKSGGYRIVYHLLTNSDRMLISIYSKSKQVDISASEIKEIISEEENRRSEP